MVSLPKEAEPWTPREPPPPQKGNVPSYHTLSPMHAHHCISPLHAHLVPTSTECPAKSREPMWLIMLSRPYQSLCASPCSHQAISHRWRHCADPKHLQSSLGAQKHPLITAGEWVGRSASACLLGGWACWCFRDLVPSVHAWDWGP